jgi:hypothetical protein
MTLLHGCNGLNARRMAVLWTFRTPSLGRHVHRELMRSALLDLTPIMSATAYHQRNYVERYSRSIEFLRPGFWILPPKSKLATEPTTALLIENAIGQGNRIILKVLPSL